MDEKEREEEAKRKAAELAARKAYMREIKHNIGARGAFDQMQAEGRSRAMFAILMTINDNLRELVEQGRPKPPVDVFRPPVYPPPKTATPAPEYNRVSKKKGRRRG